MLASQANKWSSCVAVVLAVTVAIFACSLCQADLSPEEAAFIQSDDYQDDMTRAIAVVYAGKKSKPAGFERTQKALITVLNQLTAPDVRDLHLDQALVDARRLASLYLDACEVSRPKCELVFSQIDAIKRDHVIEGSINQLPYLEVCERAQKKFCQQLGSNESAKKRVWNELKKEVAKEEAAARQPEEADAGKKNIWNKMFPKQHTTTVA